MMKKEALFLSAYLTTGAALLGTGFYFAGHSPFTSELSVTEDSAAEAVITPEEAPEANGGDMPAGVRPEVSAEETAGVRPGASAGASAGVRPDVSAEETSGVPQVIPEEEPEDVTSEVTAEDASSSEVFFGKSAVETDLSTGCQVSYEVLGDGQITLLYENRQAADSAQTFLGAYALPDAGDAFMGWVDGEEPLYLTCEDTYIPERTAEDRIVFAVFSEEAEVPAAEEEKEAQAVLLVEDHLATEKEENAASKRAVSKDALPAASKRAASEDAFSAAPKTAASEDELSAPESPVPAEDAALLSKDERLLSETALLTATVLSAPQQIEHPVDAGVSFAALPAIWALLLLLWLLAGCFHLLRRRVV